MSSVRAARNIETREEKLLEEPEDKVQAPSDMGKGTIYCKTPSCKNHLYGWTSSLDARYCIDCLG